ncbi:hypothetical protein NW762_013513 [Fusarium torreyae]|uniref:DSBA-like thioredoxin domain-containing protein n=1 Tax=Fusarium torreyae TaxID=1237075 RepID=A0A9W8V7P4_9HYPO|nr:hypothetical protein NW762_013513 [Fusarium torreyae]
MAIINIEIVSDFVCAWCFIAKRRLGMAISLYQKTYPGGKSDKINIWWKHYYLNYGPSTHSIEKSEAADERLSDMTTDQREKLYKRMNQIGRSVGINFKGGGKVGDTRLAHVLARLGSIKEPDVENAVIEGIFKAYHEEEKDITDRDVLRKIGMSAGISAIEVEEYLGIREPESFDETQKYVDEEARENKERLAGAGVPAITIQGQHLEGQPDVDDLMEALVKAKEGDTGS